LESSIVILFSISNSCYVVDIIWRRMMEWINRIIGQFYGEPELYYTDYSIEHMIRCEATHWFISAYVGCVVVYSLIGTTYFQKRLECHAHSTYQFLFWLGVFCAVLMHICIDAFTNIA